MNFVKAFKERRNTIGDKSLKNAQSKESESLTAPKIFNKRPPYPPDEEARIQKLLSYNILDTEAEQRFDEITQLAASICGAPIALVALMDRERNWFKSKVGFGDNESPREISFCGYCILDKNLMVVPNALQDERFSTNELVVGPANVRFYAGAPLVTPDGYTIGTLCIYDVVPREFTSQQKRALEILSHQVMVQLEIHKHSQEMQSTIIRLRETEKNLRISKEIAEISSVSSFENLLLSQIGIDAFLSFLREDYCSENLEFWMEAKNFRDSFPTRNKEENMGAAKEILEVFIKLGSIKQVNLNYETVSQIQSKIQAGSIDQTLFDLVRMEAFQNMKNDSYSRFLGSKQYNELMNDVRQVGYIRLAAQEESAERK